MDRFQILSLSGGGIRGLFTAEVLAELEEKRGVRITEHFDMICGTSIGGILALALASGMRPKDLAKILNEKGRKIFPKQHWGISFLKSLNSSSYSAEPLRELLEEVFQDKKMRDLNTRVLIPAVNYTSGQPKLFKTPHLDDYYNDLNISLIDVALATSAAPTFFPIHQIDKQRFVDGGLIGNSPAYFGIHEACYFLDEKPENIYVLGIGTMGKAKTADHRQSLTMGKIQWARSVVELTLSSSEILHNFWLKHILEPDNVLFIDRALTNDQADYIALDDASNVALETLIAQGKATAASFTNDKKLEKMLEHKALKPIFYEHSKPITQG
jgi:hypothetical protein